MKTLLYLLALICGVLSLVNFWFFYQEGHPLSLAAALFSGLVVPLNLFVARAFR